jgi:SAM-dependent methyltransferase
MMFGTREEFSYFECRTCGCVQMETIPEDVSGFYGASYYAHQPQASATPSTALARARRKFRHQLTRLELRYPRLAQKTLRLLRRESALPYWVAPMADRLRLNSRILDVGCGAGAILFDLQTAGFSDLTGIDPFIPASVEAAGVRLLKRDLFSVTETFDCVMLHHAFEHMDDPHRVFAKLAETISDTGVIVLRTPVAGTFAWRTYGKNWVQLDPPRHLFVHTRESMRLLADAAGLRIRATVFDSTNFQFWASEQYLRDMPLEHPQSLMHNLPYGSFSVAEVEQFNRDAERLNREEDADQAAFYLERAPR